MLYIKMQDSRAVSAQAEYPGNDAYCGPNGTWYLCQGIINERNPEF